MLNDTIAAISTALNNQAISIVRLSGDEAIEIANKIFDRDLNHTQGNTIIYGHIMEDGHKLDEVMVSIFRAPKSYTMEDLVEINCHGGVYITRRILSLCLANGARMALNGEFTKRAYLNGRIDLAKAESINDMINANSEVQIKSAMKGIDGSISRLIEPLCDDIMNMIGMIEVNIDYPEYDDVEIITNEKLLPKLHEWISISDEMIDKAQRFRVIKEGLKTAIVGKPNVGKSSLLNALLNKDKAIVTDIAGTTRDLVEDDVRLDNITLHLIDTAGIRESDDVVEKIGIERSLKAIEEAELVILVIDASKDMDEEDKELLELTKDKDRIIVYNKTDMNDDVKGIKVSALNGDISELKNYLNERYDKDQSLIDEDILNNERQIALMIKANKGLKDMLKEVDYGYELDLVSSDLYTVYHDLSEIIGKSYEDDLIDHLFRNFCLGK
ncbi:MAG: tRNA uridine-5-carboxymethylaminomethyl(34) synthesis GTPase MnmE [Firmicutes bacterium]|nr:tRNA uridine-5-carboxymethylaminomethyl(34) synthesis GTPase MnmE [Bacillota bacterium]